MADSLPLTNRARRPAERLDGMARRLYVRLIRPHLSSPLVRQRVKMLWFAWGYLGLLRMPGRSVADRLSLIGRFLTVDWNVVHAHTPREIVTLAHALAERPARPDEIVVEAGCWQGGSSAKLSVLCRMLGYRLWIYDSFEGVEALSEEERKSSYDFSGEYRSPLDVLSRNLDRYGDPDVCRAFKGWFSETLAAGPVPAPVRLAFIDCDVAKGTREALTGIVPSLTRDGVIFSQDCHIASVLALLRNPETWAGLGRGVPAVERHGVRLAALRFPHGHR